MATQSKFEKKFESALDLYGEERKEALAKIVKTWGDDLAPELAAYLEKMGADQVESWKVNGVVERIDDLNLEFDAFMTAIDPALDSPFVDIRELAARKIKKRGGTPRESNAPLSPWSRCPLDGEAVILLQKWDVDATEPFDENDERPLSECGQFFSAEHGTWSGQDPQGQIEQIPPAVWFFGKHIKWGDLRFPIDRDDFADREAWMIGLGSGGFDREVGGKRRLLAFIGSDSGQYSYAVDLLEAEKSNILQIFIVGPEGDFIHPIGFGLRAFLSWLDARGI